MRCHGRVFANELMPVTVAMDAVPKLTIWSKETNSDLFRLIDTCHAQACDGIGLSSLNEAETPELQPAHDLK